MEDKKNEGNVPRLFAENVSCIMDEHICCLLHGTSNNLMQICNNKI